MMAKESFEKLKKLIEQHRDRVDIGVPATDNLIKKAEGFLGLDFPEDYKQFLYSWGTLAIGPCEYYGIAGSDFENSCVPNGIWFTSVKRNQIGLSPHLIVISDNNDEYFCIDTKNLNGSNVVIWDVNANKIIGIKSENLFEFIIEDSESILY
jgi:antitoxin YobK